MKQQYDLGTLEWTLAGWTPYMWRQQRSIESGVSLNAEVPGIAARVPGSVQGALRDAGIIPDWNVGLNARLCEWVENRHWMYTARLPDDWLELGHTVRLCALGLDYSGWVLLNGRQVGCFTGSLSPHQFDLTPHLRDRDNVVQIVFDCPPRWLGQIGYTSRMTEWKPRFNYFWDWTARLVQIGIWDDLLLEVSDGEAIADLHCRALFDEVGGTRALLLRGAIEGKAGKSIRLTLERVGGSRGGSRTAPTMGALILQEEMPVERVMEGAGWEGLPIELWWPNGEGQQPLYTLRCLLVDEQGRSLDEARLRIGFKCVRWAPCEGPPPEADPWVCVVNGRPIFLQGVNWTPIRPNFADVTAEQYRALLETYRDLGCNMLRIWGGAFLERELLYDLCDELGLLVWQEFPLSSSGLDNLPPDDPREVEAMAAIAESYVRRRRHHVSLTLWCGGNELTENGKPIDETHPMIGRLRQVVAEHDPDRRFLPTSPSGPSFGAAEEDFGKGIHWDVHGPWSVKGTIDVEWRRYWEGDDALFHSEIGAPAASSTELIRRYRGDLPEAPGTAENPLWRRTGWWIEWPQFVAEHGREPERLEEYVAWSQERQAQALTIAAGGCKSRFPRCGGFLIWMGHDSFPCAANTSILDFDGRPKPAALEVGRIYRGESLPSENSSEREEG